jgi:hypothetical protein
VRERQEGKRCRCVDCGSKNKVVRSPSGSLLLEAIGLVDGPGVTNDLSLA